MQHSLEKHPVFPYVAWTLVICFGLFTGSLALELRDTTNELAAKTAATEAAINQ